jgi:hypothetical protein
MAALPARAGVLLLLLHLHCSAAVRPVGRRAVLSTAAVCCTAPPACASTAADLLGKGTAERCENGEGEACGRLAEGNEYVRMLQERSRVNRQKNADKVVGRAARARDACLPAAPAAPHPPFRPFPQVESQTVMQLSYDEYFATLDKNMVLQPNGKYAVLSSADYARLRKAGQIQPGGVDRVLVNLDAAPAAAPGAAPGGVVASQQ